MISARMNISTKKLAIFRFLINPISIKTLNPNSSISSTASSLSSSWIQTPTNHISFIHRCFSVVSNQNVVPATIDTRKPLIVSPKLVTQLIDVVKSSNGECRSELDLMDTRLSKFTICEIIRVLSCEKVLALQFFEWVRDNNPDLHRNGDVCSLMVDNCGWLNDYDTMRNLLKRFKDETICLNEKAFGFLPVLDSSRAHAMESISLVVRVLGETGGSVRSSGVYALISMLCAADCFELAKYVMQITDKKVGYYAVLVREKCKRGCTEDAYGLIKEMRAEGCEPNTRLYNYVLGSLCKIDRFSEALSFLEEMKETGVDPDEITFEIFISNACKRGQMELANESFDRLINTGRVPRLSTYAAIVKGYFSAGRYEDAYAYVRDIEVKRIPQVHKMFSLLARLHKMNGNVDAAMRILDEMMEKGLKPDFLDYANTVDALRLVGSKDLARGLEKKFAKFRVE